jgi:hypothetical protein
LTKASGDCLITFLPYLPNPNSNPKWVLLQAGVKEQACWSGCAKLATNFTPLKPMINTKPNKAKNKTKG